MKKFFYQLTMFIFFVFILGVAGGIEHGSISIFMGFIFMILGLIGFSLCIWLGQ